jgi:hypothetical protein
MALIDVGLAAIDRASIWQNPTYTLINKDNSADGTGTLTSVEIWANVTTTGTVVATFFGSSTTYTSRAGTTIGAVTAGSKQTFSGLSIPVETGDLIGMYVGSAGKMEMGTAGTTGMYYKSGNNITEAEVSGYTDYSYGFSLYGTGATAAAGGRNPATIFGNYAMV